MLKKQVTCWCNAYDFPHRIGGGRCDASEWVVGYMTNCGEYCETCIMKTGVASCDVSEGKESIRYCDGYQDYLHRQNNDRLPRDLEEEMIKLKEEQYSCRDVD